MSKDQKWKNHLLKSGIPLEYEVKKILDEKGCISNWEYSYLRNNFQKDIISEFSYDIDASYIKGGYFFDLMVECKYRHESTKWLFLPEEYGGKDEIEYTSFINANDHFTQKSKFVFKSSFPKFPLILGPLCSKGIELTTDGPNPKTIHQAVSQLSFAMADKIFSGMRHQVDPILSKMFGETIFCNIPIILTTANLYRASTNVSIEQIKNSDSIEEVSTKEDIVVIKNKSSIELQNHTYSTIQAQIESLGKDLFKERLNSFNEDLDFVISVIAENYSPSCLIVIHHSKDNVGINKLFDYFNKLIQPDEEILSQMDEERMKFEKMSRSIEESIKKRKTNSKNVED